MRLRLRILRNELPPANTLWPVSDTQKSQTIAQLLEAVNKSFPLEAEQWGLEDYVITIGGYEALHYHELSAVCKDEDEVVIRPLTYTEVRARTLLGRAQITQDGRKLADGVAFGRPALRQPVRPDITIPPRKKKRAHLPTSDEEEAGIKRVRFSAPVDEEDAQGYVEGPMLGSHKTQLPLGEEDDDDESDEDFALIDKVDGEDATSTSSSSAEELSDDTSSAESTPDTSSDDSSDDSESDSDDSSSDSSSDESSSAPSWNGIDTSGANTPQSNRGLQSTSNNGKLPNGKASKSKHKSTTNGEAVAGASKDRRSSAGTSLPYQGTNNTKKRNSRRRESKTLKYLKAQGTLHQAATLSDLQAWREGKYIKPDTQTFTVDSATTDAISVSGEGSRHSHMDDGDEAELAARRQKLLADIASGGVEIGGGKRRLDEDDDDGAPEELTSKRVHTSVPTPAVSDETTPVSRSSDAKNARPGCPSAAHRMIYSGLGIRAPKDEEQRAALRKTLASRRGPAAKAAAKLIPEPKLTKLEKLEKSMQEFPEDEEDPDWWKSKINLVAIECVDEGVTLSAPPFPFVNGWDPQYRHQHPDYQPAPETKQDEEKKKKKKKDRNQSAYAAEKRKGKSAKTIPGVHSEDINKYNMDGGGGFLNYDDEEDWEEGALLNSNSEGEFSESHYDPAAQQLQDEARITIPKEDFPALPQDVTSLSLLTEDNAQINDIITYSVLECSASTNWQPNMYARTVQLIGKDDDGWKVKIALRDLPPKQYDEDGNRMYSKFETIDIDDKGLNNGDDAADDVDAEEEERIQFVQWQEMSEPRLLKR